MYTLTSMSTPNGISTGTRHLILLMDILWVRHVCLFLLLCQLLMESQLAQDISSAAHLQSTARHDLFSIIILPTAVFI